MTTKEANAVPLDKEEDVEILRELVRYWQQRASDLAELLGKQKHTLTDEERSKFIDLDKFN
jgi:hypothetical protein